MASTKKPTDKTTKPARAKRKKPPTDRLSNPIKIPHASPSNTSRKLARFLEVWGTHGNKVRAARTAKVSLRTVNRHLKSDPVFAAAYQEIYDIGGDIIEAEMFRRAIEGVKEPVFQGGKKVGTITKYSDSLLSKMASGRLKATYGNTVELTGDPDKPLQLSDLGRDAAMAEIAAIFVAAGLRPPIDDRASPQSVDSAVATTGGAADSRTGKPS